MKKFETIQINNGYVDCMVKESKIIQDLTDCFRQELYQAVKQHCFMASNANLSGEFTVLWHRIYWQIQELENTGAKTGEKVLSLNTAIERIAQLNDQFRRVVNDATDIDMSRAVLQLPPATLQDIRAAVRAYSNFSDSPNPHPEHDFGVFSVYGQKFCWQIQYEAGGDPCNAATARKIIVKTAVEVIAELNDKFRANDAKLPADGNHVIEQMDEEWRTAVMQAIRNLDSVDDAEHDFGAVNVNGKSLYWKIDYYDTELEYSSDEPCDDVLTERVLTIIPA